MKKCGVFGKGQGRGRKTIITEKMFLKSREGKCIKVFFSIRHITTALPGRAGQPYGGRSPT